MYHKITSFIHDLYKSDDFIPLHSPYFGGNEKKYLDECIDTTFVPLGQKEMVKVEDGIAHCSLYRC